MSEINPTIKLYVKDELEKLETKLGGANSKLWKIIGGFALILGLLTTLGVYQLAVSTSQSIIKAKLDEDGFTNIKQYEKEAESIIVSLRGKTISNSGIVNSGSVVKAPDGDTNNWSILVAPQEAFRPTEGGGSESDNSIIGISTNITPLKDNTGWTISGVVTHRVGASGNQVLRPSMQKISFVLIRKRMPN